MGFEHLKIVAIPRNGATRIKKRIDANDVSLWFRIWKRRRDAAAMTPSQTRWNRIKQLTADFSFVFWRQLSFVLQRKSRERLVRTESQVFSLRENRLAVDTGRRKRKLPTGQSQIWSPRRQCNKDDVLLCIQSQDHRRRENAVASNENSLTTASIIAASTRPNSIA